ncbi:hypothetical protein CDD81_7187 [Ophiocordyceps australis]|uniref:Uncharacterized protein n=1 Tax=Ophiocordyceps australis TaxID=1399860 RepID=A0A2C5Y690_9HYPO|nr:hypothetical protein CDD81_7187 [Ophiocordyceps australis]
MSFLGQSPSWQDLSTGTKWLVLYSVCGIHKLGLVEALAVLRVTPAERRAFLIVYEAERRFNQSYQTRPAHEQRNDVLPWDNNAPLALPNQHVPALSTDGAETEPGMAFLRARGYDLAADAMSETIKGSWLGLPLNQTRDIDRSMETEIAEQVAVKTQKELVLPGAHDQPVPPPAEIDYIDPNLLLLLQAEQPEQALQAPQDAVAEQQEAGAGEDAMTILSLTPSTSSPCASPLRNESAPDAPAPMFADALDNMLALPAENLEGDSAEDELQSLHDIVAKHIVKTLRPSMASRVSRKMAAGYNAAISSGVVVGIPTVKAPRTVHPTPPSTPPQAGRRTRPDDQASSSAKNSKKRKGGKDGDEQDEALKSSGKRHKGQQDDDKQDKTLKSAPKKRKRQQDDDKQDDSPKPSPPKRSRPNISTSRSRRAPFPPAAPRISGDAPTPYVWSASEAEYAAVATRAYFATSADRIADPDSAPRRTRATLPEWPPEARLRMQDLQAKFQVAEAQAKDVPAQDADKAEFAGCADWATFAEQAEEAYFVLALSNAA